MNRRELFQSVASLAAASGVDVKASTVDLAPDTKPALAIFECQQRVSHEAAARLSTHFEQAIKAAFEGMKALVLTDGLKLTLIDSAGHVLNRRLDDA